MLNAGGGYTYTQPMGASPEKHTQGIGLMAWWRSTASRALTRMGLKSARAGRGGLVRNSPVDLHSQERTSSSGSLVEVWATRGRTLLYAFRVRGKARAIAFTPDSSTLIVADGTGNLRCATTITGWDLAKEKHQKVGAIAAQKEIRSVCVSQPDHRVATRRRRGGGKDRHYASAWRRGTVWVGRCCTQEFSAFQFYGQRGCGGCATPLMAESKRTSSITGLEFRST